MTEKYTSVAGETATEKIIEKSRFITTSRRVESEAAAKEFIAEISKKYSDATHNCYAYVCDRLGNFLRFSDDGEPQGTAGMPILEVIKSKRLSEVAVVVTRYFGGIKLGAGGLLRAYSGCAAENLDMAKKVVFETCSEIKITVDYPLTEATTRFISDSSAALLNTEYLNEVIFTVAVRRTEEGEFLSALKSCLNGKVRYEKLKEYFFPFET